MSRAITVASILALILALSFGGIRYAREARDELDDFAARGRALAESGDFGELSRLTTHMLPLWKGRERVLSFYVRHDLLEQTTRAMLRLRGCADAGEGAGALVALEQLRFLAAHIYERELPNWNNVF